MNPFLWVLVVLFALDALRESLGLASFIALVEYAEVWMMQWNI
jgi:hypothetical protein